MEDSQLMPGRGGKFRAVAVVVLGVTVAVVLFVGALTVLLRTPGPSARVVSGEGGVSLEVPRAWSVTHTHPTDPDHQEFLHGGERGPLGMLRRGGYWVSRWPARADATLATVEAELREHQRKHPRAEWSVDTGVVAGHPAVLERYAKPPTPLTRLRLGSVRFVVREFIAAGYVFQIGTWSLPHAGDVGRKLEDVAQSVQVFAPRRWRAAHLTLPGGWVERHTKLRGAAFFALSPGDPSQAWAYVFHYGDAPEATRRAARHNITARGGAITAQAQATLGGRNATRLDFGFPDGAFGMARDVEWFVSDGRGGTYVLAVGRRAGDERIHERLARTWRF